MLVILCLVIVLCYELRHVGYIVFCHCSMLWTKECWLYCVLSLFYVMNQGMLAILCFVIVLCYGLRYVGYIVFSHCSML